MNSSFIRTPESLVRVRNRRLIRNEPTQMLDTVLVSYASHLAGALQLIYGAVMSFRTRSLARQRNQYRVIQGDGSMYCEKRNRRIIGW